jgi:uncharacterized membrane protein YgcG
LKAFDIDTSHGSRALNRMYSDLRGRTDPMPNVNVPGGDFQRFAVFARGALASVGVGTVNKALRHGQGGGWELAKKFEGKVAIFLNRLLGLPVRQQALLFGYFVDTHEGEVVEAKSRGTFDDGIVSLAAESIVVVPGFPRTIHRDRASGATTQLCQISIDRGLSWEGALAKLSDFTKLSEEGAHEVAPENGFWVSTYQKHAAGTDKPWIICTTEIWKTHMLGQRVFRCRRPYNSDSPSLSRETLVNNYRKLTAHELAPGGYATMVWNFWYEHGVLNCLHGAKCRTKMAGLVCNVGKRKSIESLLTGAVLPVWQIVSQVVKRHSGAGKDKCALRVVRCEADNGQRIVGLHLGSRVIDELQETLKTLDVAQYAHDDTDDEGDDQGGDGGSGGGAATGGGDNHGNGRSGGGGGSNGGGGGGGEEVEVVDIDSDSEVSV